MFCAIDHEFDFESFVFGPRRRGRRRNMKWKIFERGDLKFVILRLISKRPMHGYEVMKALEEESKGYYRPSPGSVYPTLQMLEDEGYVTVEEADGKKIYSITEDGAAYLGDGLLRGVCARHNLIPTIPHPHQKQKILGCIHSAR